MKVKKIVTESKIYDVTWEAGRDCDLYAVVFKSFLSEYAVIAVFDTKFWADKFVESSGIEDSLEIMEIIR